MSVQILVEERGFPSGMSSQLKLKKVLVEGEQPKKVTVCKWCKMKSDRRVDRVIIHAQCCPEKVDEDRKEVEQAVKAYRAGKSSSKKSRSDESERPLPLTNFSLISPNVLCTNKALSNSDSASSCLLSVPSSSPTGNDPNSDNFAIGRFFRSISTQDQESFTREAALFFYTSGASFRIVENPHFITMMQIGAPVFRIPNSKELSGSCWTRFF